MDNGQKRGKNLPCGLGFTNKNPCPFCFRIIITLHLFGGLLVVCCTTESHSPNNLFHGPQITLCECILLEFIKDTSCNQYYDVFGSCYTLCLQYVNSKNIIDYNPEQHQFNDLSLDNTHTVVLLHRFTDENINFWTMHYFGNVNPVVCSLWVFLCTSKLSQVKLTLLVYLF